MTAYILDGKSLASRLQGEITQDVAEVSRVRGRAPGLAIIRVGNDPASQVYVDHKLKACDRVGIIPTLYAFDQASEAEILSLIRVLNHQTEIDGVLLQLPLPDPLTASSLITSIHPQKDVDGLHPLNQGYLFTGAGRLAPCTPLGCLALIKTVYPDLSGKRAVVVGRSILVGRPMAALLLHENATVTMAHSHTKNLEEITREADILVVAMGVPNAIKDHMVKPGAMVVDVGIHRQSATPSLTGDVDKSVWQQAGYVTPVPGGVGPMTVTFLLKNTVLAAQRSLLNSRKQKGNIL